MFNYNPKDFVEDMEKRALCEVCPSEKTYWATKIAICKVKNVVIVQQLCPRCVDIIEEGYEGYEDIIFKQKPVDIIK